MSDRDAKSAVQKYASTRPRADEPAIAPELENIGQCYVRVHESRGPALSIAFRFKNGNVKGMPYAQLFLSDFDQEEGIQLYFRALNSACDMKVTIAGLHLWRLYEDIHYGRVSLVESRDKLQAGTAISDVTGRALPLVHDIALELGSFDEAGQWKPAQGNWSTDRQAWVPSQTNLLN